MMLPEPSPHQSYAVSAILDWFHSSRSEFYLAGHAGTGKTTTAAIALSQLRGIGSVAAGAFTGKAANVMRQRGMDATTIHAMLYRPIKRKKRKSYDQVELNMLEDDEEEDETKPQFRIDHSGAAARAALVILDEVSMVDEWLAKDLRSVANKILVLGDPGQLPPIKGAGAFMAREPDAFLREIHRQAEASPIIKIATLAREGKPIPIGDYGDDVRVLPLTKESQLEVYREETQAICGVHRVRWVYSQRIRERRGFHGPVPCPGERVICRRNSKELGIFNGGLGTVLECEPDERFYRMSVQMDDLIDPVENIKVHTHHFAQHFVGPLPRPKMSKAVQEFDWGYVLTCHSAQGSGWPHVTVVDDSKVFGEDASRWMYTAITRAETGLTLLRRVS